MTMSQSHSSGFGRRLFPRIAIDGTLAVREVTLNVTMSVEDVSAGGFRTVSPVPLPAGTSHTLEVVEPGAPPVRLAARVVHCTSVVPGRRPYAIGWAFEHEVETSIAIALLLDYVTSALSFAPDQPASSPGRTH